MAARFSDLISKDELDNILPLLLAALLGRLRILPFPESSEELRLEALRLLSHLFDISQQRLSPFASDILDTLSKALTDTCPDAKKECCEIVKKVSQHFDAERVSHAGGPVVGSLLDNLRHQQWKVRRATLDALGALLGHEATMLEHMEDVLPHLGALLGDRTPGVRQSLAAVLEKWLLIGLSFKPPLITTFEDDPGPVGFAKLEHRIVLLLLSVAADEDVETVAPLALAGIEVVAVQKHEALKLQAEKSREKAKKMAEAAAARPKAAAGYGETPALPELVMPPGLPDPELAPEFDYSVARDLLPAPFAAGHMPAVMTTSYVVLHLPTLLPQVLANLTQWTIDIRSSAARLLRVILVLANQQVAPFVEQILVHLYKAAADDEPAVARTVLQCASMVGTFLDMNLVLDRVGKHLGLKPGNNGSDQTESGKGPGVEELWPENRHGRQVTRTVQDVQVGVRTFTASTVENRRQVFMVLAHLLPPASPPGATAEVVRTASPRLQLREVRTTLHYLEDGVHSEELLPRIFEATVSLLRSAVRTCCEEWPRVFDLLLRLRSDDVCDKRAVDVGMDALADLCGRTRRELYEEHIRARLGELLLGAETELWDERNPNRHVLETLLRNAGAAVAEHFGALVPVFCRQASPEDASVPARIDLLGLVHFLILEEDEALTAAVREHSAALLQTVLIPNCTWRAGQSNNKIRKGGMICVHSMLQRHLLKPASLNAAFADLLPVLKSCLDDSFSPDNRLIACLVLSAMLTDLQAEISADQLREVYPELLKRLDDSNDKIRTAVCDALSVFFKCLPPAWSRSLFEYILRNLFVHLDDPNPEIQRGIYVALEAAVHQDYATFLTEARAAAGKSAHPRLCEELVRLAESLEKASADAAGLDATMD
eukprot:TRINITY_DN42531_c0_g1_i1.p1 TRINITY_DN42531_c0_g1~~TRINITY_DN42531_c0_g1_i1.p1  ORF type:complete len:980 (-),score=178.02 TRINITY_DN42531_c0_g1_i1:255-2915(-)